MRVCDVCVGCVIRERGGVGGGYVYVCVCVCVCVRMCVMSI